MRQLASLLLLIFAISTPAQEVYKWKDSEGKVHFGDRSKAPVTSQKLDIKVKDLPKPVPPSPESRTKTAASTPPTEKRTDGIDPDKIHPRCKVLVNEIANTPPGTPWIEQSKEFGQLCPGITWQCIEYKNAPEKNQCGWIKRTGSPILSTERYN